jgi:hypothetical protein
MILNIQRIGANIFQTLSFVILIFGQQLFPQANFTIIGIPDTQYYTENLQGSGSGSGTGDIATFKTQMNWIVNNRLDSNIVYVAHLGDCVQNGDNKEEEWKRADTTMGLLEDPISTGLTHGIPYGIAVGNRDQSPVGEAGVGSSTTTFYNQYFGVSRFSGRDYYAGHFRNDNDNHFDTISVGSLRLIFVYIEYGAYKDDKPAVDWADSILSAYDDRHGIIVSHKLLDNNNSTNTDFSSAGDYIFSKVRENANLFLMLAGHWTKEGRRTDTRGGDSTDIVTLMSDYQGLENGGDGWLRIMRFSPADKKIYVKTYSPKLDAFKSGPLSQFELDYEFTNSPLPVELAFFSGSLNGGNIDLRWRTETEVNNYGFDIERTKDNSDWLTIGFVDGHGNSNSLKQYNFIDTDIDQSGTYYYRLKQTDNDGTYEYSDVVSVEVGMPDNFYLSQNYPNPFNPETRIDYTLPEKQFVSLRIYNTLGELVIELVNETKEAGSYSVVFDASKMPSGTYIYTIFAGKYSTAKKMSLLK